MGDVIILMGVSGSGKTTFGKELAAVTGGAFFDGDDFHPPANVEKMRAGTPLDDNDRQGWLETLRNLIAEKGAAELSRPTFLACSALKKKYRDTLREGNPSLRFVFLTGPSELFHERMRERADHYMPPSLLDSQLDTLEPPEDAVTIDTSIPHAEIVPRILSALDLTQL